MKKILVIPFLLILLIACKREFPLKKITYPTYEPTEYYNTKGETVEGFKHNGKYINPLLIGQFTAWMSDDFPYFRELDLTASDESNRFYLDSDPIIIKSKTDPRIEYYSFTPVNSGDPLVNEHDFKSCEYRYLGTLANGVQVIYYYESSYGSYNPDGLYGFKFTKEKVKEDKSKHIFMRLINGVVINQFVRFQVDAIHNRVLVIPESNLPSADFRDKSLDPYWVDFNIEKKVCS